MPKYFAGEVDKEIAGYLEELTKIVGKKIKIYSEVDSYYDGKSEDLLNGLCIGDYRLCYGPKNTYLSGWALREMPGCCGACVSTGAAVNGTMQGLGIGTILNKLRCRIAELLGFGLLICTDITNNEPQQKILAKNNWKLVDSFINPRTDNEVAVHTYELNKLGKLNERREL